MHQNGSITPSAAIEAKRAWWSSALARYTRIRREQLGMTVNCAAELSGLDLSQWCSLEDGWVPDERDTLHSIAATLQVRWVDYSILALFAGYRQKDR
jgi:hypothetical protein